MRQPAREALAVAILLLSIFVCVSSMIELPGAFRNAKLNIGHASYHWSFIGSMLLAIVAPILSVGILLRSRISAYAFFFCVLYWLSAGQFMIWLNGGGFAPAHAIFFPLLLVGCPQFLYHLQ